MELSFFTGRKWVIACFLVLLGGMFFGAITFVEAASFQQAKQLEEQGLYGGAFREYDEFLSNHPNHAGATLGILKTSIELERWVRARKALERFEQLQPNTTEAPKHGTRLYYRQEQYDTALKWANQYKKRATESWKPYHFLARIYYRLRNDAKMVQAVEDAEIRAPGSPWVIYDRLLLEHRLKGKINKNILDRLLRRAENPHIFWSLVHWEQADWTNEQYKRFLGHGLEFFPSKEPPLTEPVSESRYRTVFARTLYNGGAPASEIRSVLNQEVTGRTANWIRA
ncbi:MAG: tetratricopeptide repeat protein, partial [bacterium]